MSKKPLKNKPMMTAQIRLTPQQNKALRRLVKQGQYPCRSEAVRDAIRRLLNGEYKTEVKKDEPAVQSVGAHTDEDNRVPEPQSKSDTPGMAM